MQWALFSIFICGGHVYKKQNCFLLSFGAMLNLGVQRFLDPVLWQQAFWGFPLSGAVSGICAVCSDLLDVGQETKQPEGHASRCNCHSDGGVSWKTSCAEILCSRKDGKLPHWNLDQMCAMISGYFLLYFIIFLNISYQGNTMVEFAYFQKCADVILAKRLFNKRLRQSSHVARTQMEIFWKVITVSFGSRLTVQLPVTVGSRLGIHMVFDGKL